MNDVSRDCLRTGDSCSRCCPGPDCPAPSLSHLDHTASVAADWSQREVTWPHVTLDTWWPPAPAPRSHAPAAGTSQCGEC